MNPFRRPFLDEIARSAYRGYSPPRPEPGFVEWNGNTGMQVRYLTHHKDHCVCVLEEKCTCR